MTVPSTTACVPLESSQHVVDHDVLRLQLDDGAVAPGSAPSVARSARAVPASAWPAAPGSCRSACWRWRRARTRRPAADRRSPSATKSEPTIRLNSVKTLAKTIWPVVRPALATTLLLWPLATRSATSADERPRAGTISSARASGWVTGESVLVAARATPSSELPNPGRSSGPSGSPPRVTAQGGSRARRRAGTPARRRRRSSRRPPRGGSRRRGPASWRTCPLPC